MVPHKALQKGIGVGGIGVNQRRSAEMSKGKPLIKRFADLAKTAEVASVDNGAYCHFSWNPIKCESDNVLFSLKRPDGHRCAITESAFDTANHPILQDGVFSLMDSEGYLAVIRFYKLELLKP